MHASSRFNFVTWLAADTVTLEELLATLRLNLQSHAVSWQTELIVQTISLMTPSAARRSA